MSPPPPSLDDADRLEREAWTAIGDFDLDRAIRSANAALGIREHSQGAAHPDLIWPLSLWIEALQCRHSPRDAREAARLGERRLTLQRAALVLSADEQQQVLRAQVALYSFEGEVFNETAVTALQGEIDAGKGGPRGR